MKSKQPISKNKKLSDSKGKPRYSNFFDHAEQVMSPSAIHKSDEMAEEILRGLHLAALREHEGLRQEDVPGFSQENVSRLESRADIKLSTYERYMNSLDYDMVIVAVPRKSRKAFVVLESSTPKWKQLKSKPLVELKTPTPGRRKKMRAAKET